MTCNREFDRMLFADGEMDLPARAAFEAHMEECEECAQGVETLGVEAAVLREVIRETAARERPAIAWLAGLAASVAAVACLRSTLDWLSQAAPGVNALSAGLALGIPVLLRLPDIVDSLASMLLLAAVVAVTPSLWLRRLTASLALVVVCGIPAFPVTIRGGNTLRVEAGRTVDDSLIAAAETVRIDGAITGDVIAMARRVEIRGTVKGALIVGAQSLAITGAVEGPVFFSGQHADVEGQLARSLYAFGQTINIEQGSRLERELLASAALVRINGKIAHGVYAGATRLEAAGVVGRDLVFKGDVIRLEGQAKVGGNLRAQAGRHLIDPGASVQGKRLLSATVGRWRQPSFYFMQGIWILAALLFGWIMMRLFPSFIADSVRGVGAWWRSFGVGFAAVLAVPAAVLALSLSGIGLPVGLVLAGFLLAEFYAAKIVVALFLTRWTPFKDTLWGLAAALLVLTLASRLPSGIGAAITVPLFFVGFGSLVWESGKRLGAAWRK